MGNKQKNKNIYFGITKHISYNTNFINKLRYIVYYEVDKQDLIVKNRLVVFYLGENKEFYKRLSEEIEKINKIHITRRDFKRTLKKLDMNFVDLTIHHPTQKRNTIRNLLETRFDFMKDKTIKKGVIKGGVAPTKYLSRRLP